MLDGLDKIDWSKFRHRNGPAADVPKLLRDLISTDRKTQSDAIHELFGTIWHHGRVFEATAPAVPFLYEILKNPSCFERFSVLWLLGAIADGSSYLQTQKPGKNYEIEIETIWVKNARGAVQRGVKTVLGLLDEKNEDLRLPAVLLLAVMPEEAAQINPVLLSILSSEKKFETRAGLGLALALLGDFQAEAFRSENAKLSIALETLAKECAQDEGKRLLAYQAIEECFLATVDQEDQDWLRNEEDLLDSTNLNLN